MKCNKSYTSDFSAGKKRKKYIQNYNLKGNKWQNKNMLSIILCSIDLISSPFAHFKVFKMQICNLWWRPRPQGGRHEPEWMHR